MSFAVAQVSDASETADVYHAVCAAFVGAVDGATVRLSVEEIACARASAASVSRHWAGLREVAAASPNNGLSGAALAEIALQSTIYGGVVHFSDALASIEDGLAEAGVPLDVMPAAPRDPATAAEEVRRLLHGNRHRDGHADPANPSSGPLYEIVARHGYGTIWVRPGLPLRLRLVCALASLAVTGPDPVLAKFAVTARDHGFDAADIREVVMLTVLVQGSPRTLHALMTIERALLASG